MRTVPVLLGIPIPVLLLLFGHETSAQTDHNHAKNKSVSRSPALHDRGQNEMSNMDTSDVMQDPHHVLAISYARNIRSFATAIRNHVEESKTFDSSFVRESVEEIKRSFEKLEMHHGEHIRNITADMRSKMGAMTSEMDGHRLKLKEAIAYLDKDTRADASDAKRIAADCNEILKHVDEMSKINGGMS